MLEKEKKETYNRWKELVNMSKSELQKFYNSKEGKSAGLTAKQANDAGIDSGRESARWIMKMKDTPVLLWTPTMWKWANKQISFISRMSGMKGKLYDDKGNKTRKHLALLIWGNNPEKYEGGGELDSLEKEMSNAELMYEKHKDDSNEYEFGVNEKNDKTFATAKFVSPKYRAIEDYLIAGLKKKGYNEANSIYAKTGTIYIKKYWGGGEYVRISDHIGRGGIYSAVYDISSLKEAKEVLLNTPNKKDVDKEAEENRVKSDLEFNKKQQWILDNVTSKDLIFFKNDRTYQDPELFLSKHPNLINVKITELGIKNGQMAYKYEGLKKKSNEILGEYPTKEYIEWYNNKNTFSKGGELNKKNMSNKTINPDATIVKNYFGHNSGSAGGLLVGNRHSEGGIKAINKSTGNPIEMEGGEVVITRPAVSDNSKRQFEGEMLTNREILSKINQSGGGVAIMEDGGSLKDYNCSCTGHKYNYGGNLMDDHDIVKQIHEEERIKERQAYYRSLPTTSYQDGGEISKLTDTHKKLLKRFDNGERIVLISKKEVPGISYLEDKALIYITPNTEDHTQMDVFITEDGKRFIDKQGSDYFKYGGTLQEELKLAEGGSIIKDQSYYKGTNHSYENQFLINKAIEALIESVPGELMTPEEKNFVGYYAGYGGLEKYGASGKGLLYEYFTPSVVAKKMWGLAYKHGFEGGKVLEPSCGIGEFIKYAPDQRLVTGYEINDFSAKICRILYPNAKIVVKPFETIFIKNNNSVRDNLSGIGKYSLVIGNPPYGSMGGIYAGMGEKKYTKANNYIEYFISRGLDLLESGGLLIYIIGTEVAAGGKPFLQQPNNPLKGEIAEKASLVDAYRLFNGLFDTTDVLTDIVVFKKK